MHKHSSDSKPELKFWQNIPDWQMAQVNDKLYAARIGYAVTEPKEQTVYEDNFIKLSLFSTEAKTVLGYTILAKMEYNTVKRDWYLGLINPNVTTHHSPVVLYKDAQVFLRKFNGETDHSYWMILRNRTT